MYFGTRDFNSKFSYPLGLEGKDEASRKKITTHILPKYLPIFNKVIYSIQFSTLDL